MEQSLAESASGIEGSVLSYGLLDGPPWLAMDNTRILSGIPITADVGSNSFTVGVSDPQGAIDLATLYIEVLPGRAPEFTGIEIDLSNQIILTTTGAPGQTYIIQASTNLMTDT